MTMRLSVYGYYTMWSGSPNFLEDRVYCFRQWNEMQTGEGRRLYACYGTASIRQVCCEKLHYRGHL